MRIAHFAVACLVPLAVWILVSGMDDLFISVVFLFTSGKRSGWPPAAGLAPERRIAILVPLWREHCVIARMLENNLAAIRYSAYDVFVGVYPNDADTVRVVDEVARTNPRVHMAIGPKDGPTSKGDCLNVIYRHMGRYEARHGIRFDIVMTHDAEDLVHPDSLRLINWFSREYAMVQVPVLPLPTPLAEMTHGLYCDEFAEFQTKDIPVRQRLGGFLPANGVGTGFSRTALDHLAETRGGLVFDPDCLTEDYENGFGLQALGYRQLFLPLRFENGGAVATREYFPRSFRAAVRQRSRWVAGIVLQGWQNHGWRVGWRQAYWFWRDRKGLVSNLLSPFANAAFLAGPWLIALIPRWLSRLCVITYAIAFIQLAVRARCSARVYGWRFAGGAPFRMVWGNVVNFCATVSAIRQFVGAHWRHRSMAWRKTEHVYPRPRLGEVLVRLRALTRDEVERAVPRLPAGMRLGEYLVQIQVISEETLYQALSVQSDIPTGFLRGGDVDRLATRILPVRTSRRWSVLPYRVVSGVLHVATADVPSAKLTRELSGFSSLEIRYRLVRPRELAELTREYLPPVV